MMYTAYVFYPYRKYKGTAKWPTKEVAQKLGTDRYSIEEIDVEAETQQKAVTKLLDLLDGYEGGYEYIYMEERVPEVQVWSLK